MLAQLTRAERQSCIAIVVAVMILGAALTVLGLRDPLGAHGLLIVALSFGALIYLLTRYDTTPLPAEDRSAA